MTNLFGWSDFVLLAWMGVFAFWGWRSGLMKMGFRLLSFAAALVLAWMLYPIVAEILRNTPLYQSLFTAVSGSMPETVQQSAAMPQVLQQVIEQGSTAATNVVAAYFARLLLNLIAFVLVLLVSRLLLWGLKKILNLVVSLPVIGFFNRLAGLALGALEGFLVACILLAAVSVIPPLRENEAVTHAVENSIAVKILYQHNPVLERLLPKSEENGAV